MASVPVVRRPDPTQGDVDGILKAIRVALDTDVIGRLGTGNETSVVSAHTRLSGHADVQPVLPLGRDARWSPGPSQRSTSVAGGLARDQGAGRRAIHDLVVRGCPRLAGSLASSPDPRQPAPSAITVASISAASAILGPMPDYSGSSARLGADVGLTRGACPACSATDIVDGALAPRGHRLQKCLRCGLQWRLDPPDATELELLYRTGFYVPSSPRGGPLVRQLHQLNNRIRLREIRDLPPGRLIDVGSGKGRFLAAAHEAGWQVLGVEFASASAAAAHAAYGVEVVSGDFLAVPLDGQFDVVTMWHVLEHLPDPAAALARAASILRPGGRLVVSVPNIDSVQARLGGDAWFHLDPSRHLFHFGPRSLSAMVSSLGFRVDRIGHFYPEMEMIGLIQTALGRAGLEDDLLYRFAKRDPTAPFGGQIVLSLALAMALTPAAAMWTALAPILRTGASIQMVASHV